MKATPIDKTIAFVKQALLNAEAGHDWFHVERVWNNAKLILKSEKANALVVELAALLHDIADSKFHAGDEELGPTIAEQFLRSISLPEETVNHITNIIRYMSFKSGFEKVDFSSKEMDIVQDADRLDALGAIGIARAFHYGGFKNRPIYDPEVKPQPQQSKEAYKNSTAPTINHFYEKLLLLSDRMNTSTAKRIAAKRHQYMEGFLLQFYEEWNGIT